MGKLRDIDGRVKGVEREAKIQRRLGKASGGSAAESPGGDTAEADANVADDAEDKPDLSHLLDPVESPAIPFVSKKSLQSAVEDLREELRHWLDMLHASMLDALNQKADHENVKEIVGQLTQAAGMAGGSIAIFAKRSLVGKCASCDTPFNVDPSTVKRAPPVGLKAQMQPRGAPGAENAIRPLEGQRPATTMGSPGKLPKIDGKGNKDFPKGKILRNASSPELASKRQAELPSLPERHLT